MHDIANEAKGQLSLNYGTHPLGEALIKLIDAFMERFDKLEGHADHHETDEHNEADHDDKAQVNPMTGVMYTDEDASDEPDRTREPSYLNEKKPAAEPKVDTPKEKK